MLLATVAAVLAVVAAGLGFSMLQTQPPAPIQAPGGMKLLPILAGTFDMGCTAGQSGCGDNEDPAHSVTLTNDFWMSATEVTQGQWQALMGSNPSYFENCGENCPVERVDWYEILVFANAMSSAEGLAECYTRLDTTVRVNSPTGSVYDCEGYRLPTEAEWEYAARAGTDLLYAGSDTVGDVAWYDGNSVASTHPVAKKLPNAWGLYDMSGHVMEWVWDRYGAHFYSSSPGINPEGPSSGVTRVFRGGSWFIFANFSRVSYRYSFDPADQANVLLLGFRLSRTIPPPSSTWSLVPTSAPAPSPANEPGER